MEQLCFTDVMDRKHTFGAENIILTVKSPVSQDESKFSTDFLQDILPRKMSMSVVVPKTASVYLELTKPRSGRRYYEFCPSEGKEGDVTIESQTKRWTLTRESIIRLLFPSDSQHEFSFNHDNVVLSIVASDWKTFLRIVLQGMDKQRFLLV